MPTVRRLREYSEDMLEGPFPGPSRQISKVDFERRNSEAPFCLLLSAGSNTFVKYKFVDYPPQRFTSLATYHANNKDGYSFGAIAYAADFTPNVNSDKYEVSYDNNSRIVTISNIDEWSRVMVISPVKIVEVT